MLTSAETGLMWGGIVSVSILVFERTLEFNLVTYASLVLRRPLVASGIGVQVVVDVRSGQGYF